MVISARSQFLKNRTSKALLLIAAIAVVAAWFFLSQASQSTTAVIRLHQLAVEKEMLRRENAQLLYQISALESSTHLREEAIKKGFGPPATTEYLPFDFFPTLPADQPIKEELVLVSASRSQFTLWGRIISYLWVLIAGESTAQANP